MVTAAAIQPASEYETDAGHANIVKYSQSLRTGETVEKYVNIHVLGRRDPYENRRPANRHVQDGPDRAQSFPDWKVTFTVLPYLKALCSRAKCWLELEGIEPV